MNYSSILVVAEEGRLDDAVRAASEIDGVDVHAADPTTRRIVCTIEAENVDEEVRIFELVRRASGVLDVSLIEHRIDEPTEG
ncbi:chaperone NapD [Sutterella megalosphaeroides]|uniref:Chaperone NapD n=1 Tax=Sutterella megalosphaeroides TaxID=2494234 RepID=A0A2Z6I7K4_9BURK|nr:chaperone NapD [Sutterella megalosphaeroides]BBF22373.1 hypothetical protein SUTMEG_02640 [Sutterella megalosphaeroides]